MTVWWCFGQIEYLYLISEIVPPRLPERPYLKEILPWQAFA